MNILFNLFTLNVGVLLNVYSDCFSSGGCGCKLEPISFLDL